MSVAGTCMELMLGLNPFMTVVPKKLLNSFGNILLTRSIFRKYLKEKRCLEPDPQLSFIYIVNLFLIPKLFSKVQYVQKILCKEISEWVYVDINFHPW